MRGSSRRIANCFWPPCLECCEPIPKALRYEIAVMGLYQHFGPFHKYLLGKLDRLLAADEAQAAPAAACVTAATVAAIESATVAA